MLQPRKHAGRATYKPSRDYRMWKAVASKGLCEIEEIDREEKTMQSLERFMRAYPAVWSESSVQHLLVVLFRLFFSNLIPCLSQTF